MDGSVKAGEQKYQEIAFNRDEWIEGLSGHHGAVIDHVKFLTNKGRVLRFGSSDGGEPFEIEIPYGQCVGALKGGYGGDLHNIGCSVIPQLPSLQYQYGLPVDLKILGVKSYGPTHGDTKTCSDVEVLEASAGQHKLKSLTVYYSDECVYGLCVEYEENGRLIKTRGIGSSWNKEEHKQKRIYFTNDEFIKNIYGYIGDYCDLLIIVTSNGDLERFGDDRDPNFNLEIDDDKVVTGISFGIGGHLHNITAHYAKRPLIRRFDAPSAALKEYSLVSKSTGVFGKVHGDSQPFNDFNLIEQWNPSLRLCKLTVYFYPNECVYGFRHKWMVNGEYINGGKHRGGEYSSSFWAEKKSISLKHGEYITRIFGRNGDYFDQIGFELSTGEIFEFGGSGGEPFEVELPPNSAVGCITGGTGGHLHNIQVWYGPISDLQQNPPSCFYLPIENRFPYSTFIGATHGDTTPFGDNIDTNQQNFRLDTIKVYYTDKCIWSIYEVDGQYVYGDKHMTSWINEYSDVEVGVLNLEIDEFITKISGHYGNQIERVHFETNKGRVMEAGHDEGGNYFEVGIPEGSCLGKIDGGKNGHIHNLTFHYNYL